MRLVVLYRVMPSRKSTYDAALAEVKEYFTPAIYKEMERYLCGHQPHWWGEQGGDDFAKLMLLATCMHDARAYSYAAIRSALKPKVPIWNTAIQHNVKTVRRVLADWGDEHIYLPSTADRNAAVADRTFPDFMKKVRFWLDSTDVPLARIKKFKSRKGDYWSGKLSRPAWRYMALRDGNMKIRYVWGGYSPKTYDAEFMRNHKKWFKDNLSGVAILADTHFFKARE